MNTTDTPPPLMTSEAAHATRAVVIMLGGIAFYDAISWYLALQAGAWQLFVVAVTVLAFGLAGLVGLALTRRGRGPLGVGVTIGAFLVTLLVISGMISGLGLSLAVIGPVLTAAIASEGGLSRRGFQTALLAAVAAGAAMWAVDQQPALLAYRASVPPLQAATPAIAAILSVAYAIALLRLLAALSLRAKLIIAFLVVSLIPLAVLASLNYRSSRQSLTAAANEALRGAAAQTALSLDTYLDHTRGVVQSEAQQVVVHDYLALAPEARDDSPQERELLAAMALWQRRDTRNRAYMLLDASGIVLVSTTPLDEGNDHSARDFFIQAMATGQSFVSTVHFEPRAEQGDIYFAMPVRNPATFRVYGVLVARYNARLIQDIVEQTNGLAGAESYGAVFDENNVYLAHGTVPTTTFKLAGSATPEQVAALQAAFRLPSATTLEYTAGMDELAQGLAQGGPFFSAHDVATGDRVIQVGVVEASTFPWKVAFFQPQDVFLAPIQQQTQATLTLAALIALIVTGGAVAAAQVLSDPLVRLTTVAERVASGDLSAQADVTGRDEIGALARTFNLMTARLNEMVSTLEQRVAERTSQLQAAADISRATASVRNLDDLLRLSLDLIRERFGFYHASIFLIDPAGQYAVLRESTGPVGAQLKARGHRLAVGSQSLIGWITSHRQPRVALDVAEDPFHFRNPLLPDTRSELAIPLISGDRLVGALDVQSKTPNAFSGGDIQVLQTLADQLSVAIVNAELFQRTEASLEEMKSLYQRLAGTSWRTLLRGQARETIYRAPATDTLRGPQAAEPLVVPLELRDRQVGVIEIHGRAPDDWSAEERAALGTIAAQVAAALESAALLEETQRRRLREQLINEITYQMRATLNPTAVVHSGIRELGRVVGATEVVVRLAGEGRAEAASGPPAPARQEGER